MVAVPIPAPIDVPLPGGGVTQVPWPTGVPAHGVPVPIGGTVLYTDEELNAWIQEKLHESAAAQSVQLDYPNVIEALTEGLNRLQNVMHSLQFFQNEYFQQTARALDNKISVDAQANATFALQNLARILEIQKDVNHIQQVDLPNLFRLLVGAVGALNDRIDAAQYADRAWALEHVYRPLRAQVVQEGVAREHADQGIINVSIPDAIKGIMPAISLSAAVGAAALRAANKAQDWIDDCGEPMCKTLGPKTNLGKLLKGLNLAAVTALLAELAGMNADDLARLIDQLAHKAGDVITDFEQFLAPGGQTFGDLVRAATGSVL